MRASLTRLQEYGRDLESLSEPKLAYFSHLKAKLTEYLRGCASQSIVSHSSVITLDSRLYVVCIIPGGTLYPVVHWVASTLEC
jgi:hypothetical protein